MALAGLLFNYGNRSLSISSNYANLNIHTYLIAQGWDGISPITAIITINSGVFIYSTSTANPAMTVGSAFPTGSNISIVNNGTIIGRGGDGGNGGNTTGTGSPSNGYPGHSGGLAIDATANAISITNNYLITGGGGGGGGGAGVTGTAGSGGGAGVGGGNGGYSAGYSGANSSLTAYGAGGPATLMPGNYGAGGNGGGYAQVGNPGTERENLYPTTMYYGGAGGAAGDCVHGNSNITWVATGTRYGNIL